MIVDDTPDNLKVLMDMLHEQGYRVLAFTNGPEALKGARRSRPDLILLDILMPEMDGFEVCRRLKADENLRHIPVLFISAVNEPQDKVQAFSVGAADYVTKPFNIMEVKARVQTHLRLSRLMRESRIKKDAIISALPDLIFVMGRDGTFLEFHASATDGLQFEPEQFIGRTLREVMPGDMAGQAMDALEKVRSSKEVQILEYPLTVHNQPKFFEARLTILDENRFLGIVRDITRQKAAQEALIESREKAETASKAKSEFLNNMSHELRTPLNGITGVMELLLSTTDDAETEELLSLGVTSARRLTSLLSNILDLSSLETGRIARRSSEFSIRAMARSLQELFEITARDKGLELVQSIDPALPEIVTGDGTRFHQVLFNLLGNAIKFTEKGRVSMDISALAPGSTGDLRVLVSISDTGIGISDHHLKNLFQPFIQADGKLTREYEGAGLGLVLVKRLVEMMNGTLCVENHNEQGTVFHVCLPFYVSRAEALTDKEDQAAPEEDIKQSLRILVAEDEPLNQQMMGKILEQEGHEAVLAENGQQAVELYSSQSFDCILMDIQMPVMTGVEAARRIRALEAEKAKGMDGNGNKRIPIIAVTAHTLAGDRERFLEAGMDDYQAKPLNIEELRRVLMNSC